MFSGEKLIKAISDSEALTGLKDCGAVPSQLARAVYDEWPAADVPETISLQGNRTQLEADLRKLLAVPKTFNRTTTAVWHFLTTNDVHHFAVVPWISLGAPRVTYTVLMAYVNAYSLADYILGSGTAPQRAGHGLGLGYRRQRSEDELVEMLINLMLQGDGWRKYFGVNDGRKAIGFKCWKYPYINLATAVTNVRAFRGL